MLLYIIRHGDPDYEHNTITPFGHKEAQALSEWFTKKNILFDEIYTSPLGRAIDTAKYTCDAQHVTPSVLPWTEESMDYMQPFLPCSSIDFRFTANGIEDYQDYAEIERMDKINTMIDGSDALLLSLGYERVGSHYRIHEHNDKKVAVFCHGGFGSAWTAHLLGMAPTLGFPSMFMTTTSYNVFEFLPQGNGEYTKPRMLHFGDISHLHDSVELDNRDFFTAKA